MTRAHGAAPADWAGWVNLGLQADLLPVVSNRALPVSATSNLADSQIGKIPSTINPRGEVVGFTGWSAHQATDRDIARWSAVPDLGICLIGRNVKGIDIDVRDPVLSAEIADTFMLLLGELPVRGRADSGKRLLPVRLPVDLPRWRFTVRDGGGMVELLGNRQQFIVAGTHPDGARYEWADGVPAEIPAVSLEDMEAAWSAVYAAYGEQGTSSRDRKAGGQVRPRTALETDDPAAEYLWGGGHVREEALDGSLFVVCPWQHEHTDGAAGAASSTVFWPAGVGADRRGFKCLHGHCAGRTNFDFLRAVGFEAQEIAMEFDVVVPTAPPSSVSIDRPFDGDFPAPVGRAINRDKFGRVESNATALGAYLDRPDLCGARLAYDEFKGQVVIEWHDQRGRWRPLRDEDYFRLRVTLEGRDVKKPGGKDVREAVWHVARNHCFDTAIDWVTSLVWDGVPRVERFYVDYCGVAETPYALAVGRYTWTALAGRALVPGIKADMIPVLVGAQGLRKTSAIEAMAPELEMFVEVPLDVKDDDLARRMLGKLVGELGELRGLNSKNAEAIKQWIVRRQENWVPKYQENPITVPRRTILFGTGNIHEFLSDSTGNRRWLPLMAGRSDVDAIKRDRAQLWAEGRALFCSGGHEVDWSDAETLAPDQHLEFAVSDAWQPRVAQWLQEDEMDQGDGPETRQRGAGEFTLAQVLTGAAGVEHAKINKMVENRMADILKSLQYEGFRKYVSGVQIRMWRRKTS